MHQTVCSCRGDSFSGHPLYCRVCGAPVPPAPGGVASKPTGREALEESDEIRLDRMAAFDHLLIQPRNSRHRFTLLEPARGYGLSSGGLLGDRQVQALMPGAFSGDAAEPVQSFTTLRVGMSVIFHLGFAAVEMHVVQPVGTAGEVKLITPITMENIADCVLEDGLATRQEIAAVVAELDAFAADPRTVAGLPRVVQTWGRRPG